MEELINKISAAYEQAELRILDKMQQLVLLGLDEDELADTLLGKKLSQLKVLREETVKQLRQLATLDDEAKAEILKQFLQGTSISGDIAGSNSAALNNLLADYLSTVQTMRFQILRQTQDVYRNIIAQVADQAALGVATRIQTARRALEKFAGEGITGFVSRDNRHYEIRSYVEMATRTTLLNAQREGRINNIDNDLIIINKLPNPSPLCEPYERKILSISGNSEQYPSLASAKANGLFHPNCRHSFTAYIPGLTKINAPQETDDYEETQEQRYLERQIRAWKRREAVMEDKSKARNRITEYRNRLVDLTEEFDLVRKRNREGNVSAR